MVYRCLRARLKRICKSDESPPPTPETVVGQINRLPLVRRACPRRIGRVFFHQRSTYGQSGNLRPGSSGARYNFTEKSPSILTASVAGLRRIRCRRSSGRRVDNPVVNISARHSRGVCSYFAGTVATNWFLGFRIEKKSRKETA